MAAFDPLRWYCFLNFSLLILLPLTLSAVPIPSFSLKDPNFDSNFALLGDAQMVKGGSMINLTSDSTSSAGQLVYKKPINFLDGNSQKPISFSSDFAFSMFPGPGDGMAFAIVPAGTGGLDQIFDHQGLFGISENVGKIDGKFIAVEFDTRKDDNVGDVNGNHVGFDLGNFSSAEVVDVSSVGLVLNGGDKLRAWIDYEANSKRLEIRLNKFGVGRPYKPLISYPIDLSKIWAEKEVLVAISSSSGHSTQICSLYSWSFRVRTTPNWLHSEPLDPQVYADEHQVASQKKNCALTILGRLIFTTGCGTLVAFFVLLFWVVFFTRQPIPATELPMNTMDFKYEKVGVNIDKISDDSTS